MLSALPSPSDSLTVLKMLSPREIFNMVHSRNQHRLRRAEESKATSTRNLSTEQTETFWRSNRSSSRRSACHQTTNRRVPAKKFSQRSQTRSIQHNLTSPQSATNLTKQTSRAMSSSRIPSLWATTVINVSPPGIIITTEEIHHAAATKTLSSIKVRSANNRRASSSEHSLDSARKAPKLIQW